MIDDKTMQDTNMLQGLERIANPPPPEDEEPTRVALLGGIGNKLRSVFGKWSETAKPAIEEAAEDITKEVVEGAAEVGAEVSEEVAEHGAPHTGYRQAVESVPPEEAAEAADVLGAGVGMGAEGMEPAGDLAPVGVGQTAEGERPSTVTPEEVTNFTPEGPLSGRAPPRRNINLDFFEEEDTKAVIELYNLREGGFQDRPERQVRTHEETRRRAEAVDIEKIIGAPAHAKWEPEELVAAYQMADRMAAQLNQHAKDIETRRSNGVEVGDEELAAWSMRSDRLNLLMETVSVRAAEAGRMLNALQAINRTTRGRQYLEQIAERVAGEGGRASIQSRIRLVAETDSLGETAAAVRMSKLEKGWAFMSQLRYNYMLSSVRTHVANISGSILSGTYEMGLKKPLAVGVNNLEYLMRMTTPGIQPMPGEQRMSALEIPAGYLSLLTSTKSALSVAKKVFSGEELGEGKLYNEMGMRRSIAELPQTPAGKVGRAVRLNDIPSRALEAEDAFFRTIYFNSKLSELAMRRAVAEGGSMGDVNRLYRQYTTSPTDDMVEGARVYAQKLTYTNDPSYYGAIIGNAARIGAELQDMGSGFGRLVLPFVRTPANLTGYSLDAAGLGGLTSPRRTLAELTSENPELRADAVARFTIAAGLFMVLEEYWNNGVFTGAAPENFAERAAREASGWRENAILAGGEYHQLNRLDPLGQSLGIIATVFDLMANSETEQGALNAGMGGVLELTRMLSDRSFLSGLGDVIHIFDSQGIDGPKRVGYFLSRTAQSFMLPSAVRDVREMADPYQRELATSTGLIDATADRTVKQLMNAVPGMSQQLPPRVDAHGEYMLSQGNMFWRGFVPVRAATLNQDEVSRAYIANRSRVRKPRHVVTPPGGSRMAPLDLLKMDDNAGWVYHRYQREIGKARHAAVKALVNSADYKRVVRSGQLGEDSLGQELVQRAVARGTRIGKLRFFKDMANKKFIRPRVGAEYTGERIELTHQYSPEEYRQLLVELAKERRGEKADLELIESTKERGVYRVKERDPQAGVPPELRYETPGDEVLDNTDRETVPPRF